MNLFHPMTVAICVLEGQFSLNCRVYNQIIINRTESNHFFLSALVPLNKHMYQLCTNPVHYQIMRKSSICSIRSYASTTFGSTSQMMWLVQVHARWFYQSVYISAATSMVLFQSTTLTVFQKENNLIWCTLSTIHTTILQTLQ